MAKQGETNFMVSITVKAPNWKDATRFDFFGRSFDTQQAATDFISKVNPDKIYNKRNTIVYSREVVKISNWCAEGQKVERILIGGK